MAISAAERRFLRSWEEQRQGGKNVYVATYTFGLTLLIFICCIALGLFLNIPFITQKWLISIAAGSLAGGFFLSFIIWSRQQKRFRRIINREIDASN